MEVNILLVFIYILDLIRHYCQSLLRDADAGKSGENLCDETMLQILWSLRSWSLIGCWAILPPSHLLARIRVSPHSIPGLRLWAPPVWSCRKQNTGSRNPGRDSSHDSWVRGRDSLGSSHCWCCEDELRQMWEAEAGRRSLHCPRMRPNCCDSWWLRVNVSGLSDDIDWCWGGRRPEYRAGRGRRCQAQGRLTKTRDGKSRAAPEAETESVTETVSRWFLSMWSLGPFQMYVTQVFQ